MILTTPNKHRKPDDVFRYILGKLWKSVVEPVISHQGLEVSFNIPKSSILSSSLSLQKSDAPLSLRWCPTGPFSFLPLHAAGLYGAEESKCIFDYVVSSYTPTISALLRDMPPPSTPLKMVVVVQPELPCTKDELRRVKARVPVTKDNN